MKILDIQDLIKFFAVLCMVLIVGLPISLAQESEWFAEMGREDQIQEGMYEDFAVVVKNYEPVVLVSSILEEQNVPIYAHLMAIPTVPGMGIPVIRSISVRESGTNTLSGVRYFKPALYSWDNFGYLQTNIRRIEKEDDMPDVIDANLTATIRYESDVLPGMIGGAEAKTLELVTEDVKRKLKAKLEEQLRSQQSYGLARSDDLAYLIDLDYLIENKDKYSIASDKGYLVLRSVGRDTANFMLYNSQGRLISANVFVRLGWESSAYYLGWDSGSSYPGTSSYGYPSTPSYGYPSTPSYGYSSTSSSSYPGASSSAYSFTSGYNQPENYIRIRLDEILEDNGVIKGVKVTLLAGRREGETEVSFKLHIPIEKRIDIPGFSTPEALARRINETERLIEKFDHTIDELGKVVDGWYVL